MSRKKPSILHIQSKHQLEETRRIADVIYIGSQDEAKSYPESKWIAPRLPFEDVKKYSDWRIWRAKMFEHYEHYIRSTPLLMNSILELEGVKLACWCDMYPCYGEVLIKIFCEKTGQTFVPHDVTLVPERN